MTRKLKILSVSSAGDKAILTGDGNNWIHDVKVYNGGGESLTVQVSIKDSNGGDNSSFNIMRAVTLAAGAQALLHGAHLESGDVYKLVFIGSSVTANILVNYATDS